MKGLTDLRLSAGKEDIGTQRKRLLRPFFILQIEETGHWLFLQMPDRRIN